MLLEFRVANFRSVGEEQVLGFVPELKQKDYPENILRAGKHQALNGTALYGANASGKSNVLKALNVFAQMLLKSAQFGSTTALPYEPFLLREGYAVQPTRLEAVFVVGEIRYRYAFAYDNSHIVSEILYKKHIGREVVLFMRENDVIDVAPGFKANAKLLSAAIEATKDNALFLSTCDTFNVEEAKQILHWVDRLAYVDGLNTIRGSFETATLWQDADYQAKMKTYLSLLDLALADTDIQLADFDAATLPAAMDESSKSLLIKQLSGKKQIQKIAFHAFYDKEGHKTSHLIPWDLTKYESQGTIKAFDLSGPLLRVLGEGGILVIDEIEAKMHPMMTLNTLKLFLNEATNPLGAQIIFATHDTNLLTYAPLRRDQIYFVEKNTWESTEMYSLAGFKYFHEHGMKSERIDSDKEKRYLEGRYGAVPLLGSFFSHFAAYGKER